GGDMLAACGAVVGGIGVEEPQRVGKQEGLAIFAERTAPVVADRVDGHREEAELHVFWAAWRTDLRAQHLAAYKRWQKSYVLHSLIVICNGGKDHAELRRQTP